MTEIFVEFVSSQKKSSDGLNEQVAIYKSYIFHKESVLDKNGNLKFRCANRHHSKCKARITVENDGKLVSEEPVHNHPPKPGDAQKRRLAHVLRHMPEVNRQVLAELAPTTTVEGEQPISDRQISAMMKKMGRKSVAKDEASVSSSGGSQRRSERQKHPSRRSNFSPYHNPKRVPKRTNSSPKTRRINENGIEEDAEDSVTSSSSRGSVDEDLPPVPSAVIDTLITELQLIRSNVTKAIEKLQSVKAAINGDPVSPEPFSEVNGFYERPFIDGLRQPKSEVEEYGY